MRQFFSVLLVSATIALPGYAQQASETEIQSTIENQIEAFRAEDYSRAFSFASPMIKGIFGTPDNFGAMVRRGYPMVQNPGSIRMLGLRTIDGKLWQRVLMTDQAGAAHMLDYRMLQTPDGWQIDAVQILPQSGVGA
ncbi:DUF4864 domain-containing protein [Pseudorhodobacter sp.]|uniref:DUF4864 domain-containing protein n=1 Tax=Pseudorhodobacter sp. TaxID=1934400 RepID=UPI002649E810|nr:DUF4864 domain-containing protein [Pseudorhodobacter sp.]MDN5786703.1 DUF4864 domain-containing protein [Pseudorhodobacter sp.]